MNLQQVKQLLQRYQAGDCTASERALVEKWYRQLVETGEWQWGAGQKQALQELIGAQIAKKIDDGPKKAIVRLPRGFQWWAAASVIWLLVAASYLLFRPAPHQATTAASAPDTNIQPPQSNKAMITLANGQIVYLDSAGNGALATQGNVKLVKLANGQIAYQRSTGLLSTEIAYNTLSNPRGSKVINMTLADGSKVWLNAASSLTFPVAFIGNERKVTVSGEAYFEVAHDASQPFIVNNGAMDIRVLGTGFNVNAYQDDGRNIKVTLLEGSVKVNSGSGAAVLKPGQQAVVAKEIKIVNDADLDLVMAWKNGYFQFDNAGLESVLKEVSRWYDIDVVYEGSNKPRQFVGEIQRNLSLSEVLKLLEKNKVHFKMEDKKLRVLPD